jgi:transaldolase
MNPIQSLTERGVSIWLDTLSRELIEDGELATLMTDYAVGGATSNPTIFAKAICGSDRYDPQLVALLESRVEEPNELFLELAVEDVRRAAALMRPLHEATRGRHGFVSLEVTPDVAYDSDATVAQALDLWRRLDAPNVMIKVPATEAGVAAIEELTALGVNVNVTLLFAVERYEQVIEAYLRGLERRARAGGALAGISSVASFFVSRVDAKADPRLPDDSPLRGRLAIANARVAYGRYQERFSGPRWDRLAALGAVAQRPLWASTAPKDPDYRDVVYVEQLALPSSILTIPETTLRAFAHHGETHRTEPLDHQAAERMLAAAAELPAVTAELEHEGVESFCSSYSELLTCVEQRAGALLRAAGATRSRPCSRPHRSRLRRTSALPPPSRTS